MKLFTLPLLCALLVSPLASQGTFTLQSDSTSWLTIKRYFTAQPANRVACLFGSFSDSTQSATVDSVTIVENCALPAFGALGYLPDWLVKETDKLEFENALCDMLKAHPGWKFAGSIVGLEDKTRRPIIWSCWVSGESQ